MCAIDRATSVACSPVTRRPNGCRDDGALPPNGAAPTGAGFDQMACARQARYARKASGELTCWGDVDSGITEPPAGGFRSISGSSSVLCGIHTSGDARCWGAVR